MANLQHTCHTLPRIQTHLFFKPTGLYCISYPFGLHTVTFWFYPNFFSHLPVHLYTYLKTLDAWDCLTIISDFPDTVPAHPLDILPCIAPKPLNLCSLLCSWPYSTHHFTEFHPYHTDRDSTELRLTARPHQTYAHTLEHSIFCYECIYPTHYPYDGNKQAK